MVQLCPQRLRPLVCDSKGMNVPTLELYLGEDLHHEVVVFNQGSLYAWSGTISFLSESSLFSANVIFRRVAISIHI